MRWNEREKAEDDSKKPKKREVELSKPGKDNTEAVMRAKKKAYKGGNPYA